MKTFRILKRSLSNINRVIQRKPALLWTTILLTKKCTQRCLHCAIPLEATKEDFISLDNYRYLLNYLDSYGTQVLTLSGGEPMLHPELRECVRLAAEKKFVRVHLLTTLYGSDKMVENTIETLFEYDASMSTSFDGFGEVADRLRGGKNVAEKVMRNMELINKENKKRKNPIPTGVNVVISKLNLHQVPEILDYIESLGWSADVDIYRWASDNQREMDELKLTYSNELEKVLERVRKSPVVFTPRWLIDGFQAYLNEDFPKKCPYLDSPSLGSKFYIGHNGDVKVCIGDAVGNLFTQSLEQIFKSDVWRDRLNDFMNCPGCWNTCYTPSATVLSLSSFNDLIKILKIDRKK
ncbi:MAG: radical SAM protein [Candidatus Hatepunaea meridiana]|nr:radical SAM protein [Candidatus Hatepunaea meridiana]